MLIDTHCHLDFERFDDDRTAVVNRAHTAGIERIIVPALDLDNCEKVLALTEQYEGVFAAVGVHPNSSAAWQDGWLDQIRTLAGHQKVVAIGEIGLDYYWDRSPAATQKRALQAQLELATELDLPVILHNRESDEDMLAMLGAWVNGRENPGVLHSFFSSWPVAQQALDLGFYLGFTGPLTFKKAGDLRSVATQVPLDRLLVETDAPFLTPQQYRGKRNEPAYVRFVAERLAELHQLSPTELAEQTTANARRLFGEQLA